jgi:hypothetical protein
MSDMSAKIIAAESGSLPQSCTILRDAHIWRSKIIDKCSEAERHVLILLAARDDSKLCPTASLSHKIESLRKALKRVTPAGKCEKAVLSLLDRMERLAGLRSELAHSNMEVAELNGQKIIMLKNASQTNPFIDKRVHLSTGQLKDAHTQLCAVSHQLSQRI